MAAKTKKNVEELEPEDLSVAEFKYISRENGVTYTQIGKCCVPIRGSMAITQWLLYQKETGMKVFQVEALKKCIGEINFYRSLKKARKNLGNK